MAFMARVVLGLQGVRSNSPRGTHAEFHASSRLFLEDLLYREAPMMMRGPEL